MEFQEIIQPLFDLNADRSNPWPPETKYQAPHKPFLLLSVLDGIDEGWIRDNKILLDTELIEHFNRYWETIMSSEKKTTIALPYFHLGNESFWSLIYKIGIEPIINSPSSGSLQKKVHYATLDEDLYLYVQDTSKRTTLRNQLIHHYFDGDAIEKIKSVSALHTLISQYSNNLINFVQSPFQSHYSKEIVRKRSERYAQIREVGFSHRIRKEYDYTCVVCKDRIVTPDDQSLVEAAHIIPWSESYNDDPRNGLSLCRSHHWMFDHMMFTIENDYSIKTSPWLESLPNRVANLHIVKNDKIVLPKSRAFIPASEALINHQERFHKYHKTFD